MRGSHQYGAFWKLAHFLRCNRIDVVHCHDSRGHQIACFAARLAGTPAIVRTKHNTLPLRNLGSRIIYGPLTSRLISVSNAVKNVLVESGIPEDHITTVYNYVDAEKFRPQEPPPQLRHSLQIPQGAAVVGTVGRLHHSKGIEDLIRAVPLVAEKHPEVRFLLVGSRSDQWQPLVRELSAQQYCLFPGRVSNVPDYLGLMDVAVFPTRREAFGLSILEAMATGRVVVASEVGGVPEIVTHERSGLLVEPRRPDRLAEAVLRLLGEPDLRQRLGTAAHRTARTFTREKSIASTERVYRMALGRQGPPSRGEMRE